MSTQELPGCKCQVVFWESGGFRMVSQCPLHRHAKDLRAACEAIERVTRGGDFPGPVYLSLEEVQALRAAIARAKVKGDGNYGSHAVDLLTPEVGNEVQLGTAIGDCPTCGGTGIDRRFGMERGCQSCRGTGRKVEVVSVEVQP